MKFYCEYDAAERAPPRNIISHARAICKHKLERAKGEAEENVSFPSAHCRYDGLNAGGKSDLVHHTPAQYANIIENSTIQPFTRQQPPAAETPDTSSVAPRQSGQAARRTNRAAFSVPSHHSRTARIEYSAISAARRRTAVCGSSNPSRPRVREASFRSSHMHGAAFEDGSYGDRRRSFALYTIRHVSCYSAIDVSCTLLNSRRAAKKQPLDCGRIAVKPQVFKHS